MKKYAPKTKYYRELLTACRQELATLGYGSSVHKLDGVGELLEWLEQRGKSDVNAVVRADMEAFVDHLQSRPSERGGALSSGTVTAYLHRCRLFFNYAERHGLRGGNPLIGVSWKRAAIAERYAASRAEIERLYEGAKEDDRLTALLHLLYGCGLRCMEAERLDVGDIDFAAALLYVRSGKGRKRRVVPLTPTITEELRGYQRRERWQWMKDGGRTKALLLDDRGSRMRGHTIAKKLGQLVEATEVSPAITPHVLRHSVATHLLEGGMSLEGIRDFLGHEHLETTQLYTHITPIL